MNFKDDMKNLGIIEVTSYLFFSTQNARLFFQPSSNVRWLARVTIFSFYLSSLQEKKHFFFSVSYSLMQLNYNLHLSWLYLTLAINY